MKEFGEFLKAARLKQDLSLHTMSERTRISVSMLKAVEEGDYDTIGTPLLIRTFIRSYCNALGIDAEPILEGYAEEIRDYDQQEDGIQRFGEWSQTFHQRKRTVFYLLIFLLVLIAGLWAANYWVFNRRERLSLSEIPLVGDFFPRRDLAVEKPQPGTTTEPAGVDQPAPEVRPGPQSGVPSPAPLVTSPSGQPVTEPAAQPGTQPDTQPDVGPAVEPGTQPVTPPVPQPVPQPGPSAVGAPVSEPAAAPPADVVPGPATPTAGGPIPPQPDAADTSVAQHRLSVEAVEESWLQIVSEGNRTDVMTLHPGDTKTWEVTGPIDVIVGNAGGIRVKWDEKSVKPLGRSGEVRHFQLPNATLME